MPGNRRLKDFNTPSLQCVNRSLIFILFNPWSPTPYSNKPGTVWHQNLIIDLWECHQWHYFIITVVLDQWPLRRWGIWLKRWDGRFPSPDNHGNQDVICSHTEINSQSYVLEFVMLYLSLTLLLLPTCSLHLNNCIFLASSFVVFPSPLTMWVVVGQYDFISS